MTPKTMKTLSLRQPWLWAILCCGKRIENRYWNLPRDYRGPILLHAAKGCTKREYEDARSWMENEGLLTIDMPPLSEMTRGGICGRARIVDVVPPRTGPLSLRRRQTSLGFNLPRGLDMRWHMTDQYGFVLTEVEPLPFHGCKGQLSLYDYAYEPAPMH